MLPKYGTVLRREYADVIYLVMFVKIDEATWEDYRGFKGIRLDSSRMMFGRGTYEGWWDELGSWVIVDEA
jgi:hypothetical protein